MVGGRCGDGVVFEVTGEDELAVRVVERLFEFGVGGELQEWVTLLGRPISQLGHRAGQLFGRNFCAQAVGIADQNEASRCSAARFAKDGRLLRLLQEVVDDAVAKERSGFADGRLFLALVWMRKPSAAARCSLVTNELATRNEKMATFVAMRCVERDDLTAMVPSNGDLSAKLRRSASRKRDRIEVR